MEMLNLKIAERAYINIYGKRLPHFQIAREALTLGGNLTLGSNNLTLAQANSVGGSPSTAGTTNYHIIANSTGVISCSVPNSSSYTFPVGNSLSIYNPLTISNTAGSSQTYTVKTAAISPAQSDALSYMWVIGGSTGTCDLAFGWNTANASGTLSSAQTSAKAYSGSTWAAQTSSTASASSTNYSTTLSGTTLTNPMNWTVGVPAAPTVTTQAVSGISITSATGNGNITAGLASISVSGVVWSTTSGSESIAGSKSIDGPTGSTAGAYTSSITGLSAATIYYVKAYATNSFGATSYGSEVSFTTSASATAPTITTQSVSAITTTTATGNGNITGTGGSNILTSGVVWSTTSGSESISGSNTTDGPNGSTTGAYTSSIAGLSASTTYYVKVYATNSVGTSYGSEVSFTTLASVPSTQASSIISTNVVGNQLTLSWTAGNGSNYLVVAKQGASAPTAPTSGTSYTANTAFGSGSTTATGSYVLYSGTGTSVNVTGLSASTQYTFEVFTFRA